jgi:hypothetical protein
LIRGATALYADFAHACVIHLGSTPRGLFDKTKPTGRRNALNAAFIVARIAPQGQAITREVSTASARVSPLGEKVGMSDYLSAGGSVCVGAAFCQNEPNGDNATISMKAPIIAASPGPTRDPARRRVLAEQSQKYQ